MHPCDHRGAVHFFGSAPIAEIHPSPLSGTPTRGAGLGTNQARGCKLRAFGEATVRGLWLQLGMGESGAGWSCTVHGVSWVGSMAIVKLGYSEHGGKRGKGAS